MKLVANAAGLTKDQCLQFHTPEY